MVCCQPSRSWRGESDRSSSWQPLQTRAVSAFPGPSGNCASAPAAKTKTAAVSQITRGDIFLLNILVLNRKPECVKRTIVRAQVQLAAAAGQSAAMHEGHD